jgi:GAF domain-containing protein
MAEELIQVKGSKEEQYENLIPQLKALVEGEQNSIANLANITAALKETFHFFWVGFYIVDGDELVLGPFQGPIACTRIRKGKGVCGAAWEQQQTLVVPDVDAFPGHIACSSISKSEIVVPIFKNGHVVGVLDVDSENYNTFDADDAHYLNQICQWLSDLV